MKGLIVSLVTLALYGLIVMAGAQVLRPKRHLALFLLGLLISIPAYFVLYWITPADLYFLPRGWICSMPWLDMLYGFVVFALNCHSFVDTIIAGCSGFSVSLLVAMLEMPDRQATSGVLIAKFKPADGTDLIYGWRLPHLQKRGYILMHAATGNCVLTAKGRLVARLARFLKRLMNLGEGG
jgi:hypothetical protein